jgi:hypothetical protein
MNNGALKKITSLSSVTYNYCGDVQVGDLNAIDQTV